MANYPSLDQLVGSEATPQSGIRIDKASNGDVRSQILYSADRKNFRVLHRLNSTDKGTLDTFYTTNKALELTFTWSADSQNYNCIFADAPKYTPQKASWFLVEVNLMQKDT